jgi:hypothetical protein
MVHVFERVLLVTNCLSAYCQSKEASMTAACALVQSTISSLELMRNDNTFHKIYSDVILLCTELGINMRDEVSAGEAEAEGLSDIDSTRLKRSVAQSKRLNDSVVLSTLGQRQVVRDSSVQFITTGHSSLELKETLRKNCFEILDCMHGELKKCLLVSSPCYLAVTL